MSNPVFSVQQVAKRWNVTEDEIREALRIGELLHSYIPKWGLSQENVEVWLLKSGRITLDEFKGGRDDR
jgi:hypothetical protein